jgi:D-aminopeptidase
MGLAAGDLPAGPLNAITDVPGVRVGHATLNVGTGALQPGAGPVRTGVTVVLPHAGSLFREKVPAAVHTINGFGKALGFEQVRELGTIESPIALTGTLNVGLVADALVQHAIQHSPEIGVRAGSVNVVVAECNDGFLNDLQGRHVRAEHVLAAIDAATSGPVAEGAVGAGMGTVCFGWKGGIGTASRVVPAHIGGYTVGALAQTNFGRPEQLTIRGVPVGKYLLPPGTTAPQPRDAGSVVVVLATNAPLSDRQLGRLCARVAAGLARTGSVYGHGSGDFAIAFSTAEPLAHQPAAIAAARTVVVDEAHAMEWLFPAVVESVEEAVINSLCAAATVVGRDGNTAHALPIDQVIELMKRSQTQN